MKIKIGWNIFQETADCILLNHKINNNGRITDITNTKCYKTLQKKLEWTSWKIGCHRIPRPQKLDFNISNWRKKVFRRSSKKVNTFHLVISVPGQHDLIVKRIMMIMEVQLRVFPKFNPYHFPSWIFLSVWSSKDEHDHAVLYQIISHQQNKFPLDLVIRFQVNSSYIYFIIQHHIKQVLLYLTLGLMDFTWFEKDKEQILAREVWK
jgi:hypothetical protein